MSPAPRPRVLAGPPAVDDADVAAIRRIVNDVETGMNTNDAELAARAFAGDARTVDVRGRAVTASTRSGALSTWRIAHSVARTTRVVDRPRQGVVHRPLAAGRVGEWAIGPARPRARAGRLSRGARRRAGAAPG